MHRVYPSGPWRLSRKPLRRRLPPTAPLADLQIHTFVVLAPQQQGAEREAQREARRTTRDVSYRHGSVFLLGRSSRAPIPKYGSLFSEKKEAVPISQIFEFYADLTEILAPSRISQKCRISQKSCPDLTENTQPPRCDIGHRASSGHWENCCSLQPLRRPLSYEASTKANRSIRNPLRRNTFLFDSFNRAMAELAPKSPRWTSDLEARTLLCSRTPVFSTYPDSATPHPTPTLTYCIGYKMIRL